jgi:hypothetical protein
MSVLSNLETGVANPTVLIMRFLRRDDPTAASRLGYLPEAFTSTLPFQAGVSRCGCSSWDWPEGDFLSREEVRWERFSFLCKQPAELFGMEPSYKDPYS